MQQQYMWKYLLAHIWYAYYKYAKNTVGNIKKNYFKNPRKTQIKHQINVS